MIGALLAAAIAVGLALPAGASLPRPLPAAPKGCQADKGRKARPCRCGQPRRCRFAIAPARPAPLPPPAPAPAPPPSPTPAPPPAVAPSAPAPPPSLAPAPAQPAPPPAPPPSAEPWFLTVYARDVGNGDFRLTPWIGEIPAGPLRLTYRNTDATAHDLWLARPGDGPVERIFGETTSDEVPRATLTLGPGAHVFLCRLPGHDAMRLEFGVVERRRR